MNTFSKYLFAINDNYYTNKTSFIGVIIMQGAVDCIAQSNGYGRYYERNLELLPASTVVESTLLAICLFAVSLIILNKNNINPYLVVAGIGSMLVGLICLIPLFAYLFIALKFVVLLIGLIGLIVFIWKIINKDRNVSSNVIDKASENLFYTEQDRIVVQPVRTKYVSKSSKRDINRFIFLILWPIVIFGALIANAFIHDLFGFYILEYVVGGFLLVIGFTFVYQLLIIIINIIKRLSNR